MIVPNKKAWEDFTFIRRTKSPREATHPKGPYEAHGGRRTQ